MDQDRGREAGGLRSPARKAPSLRQARDKTESDELQGHSVRGQYVWGFLKSSSMPRNYPIPDLLLASTLVRSSIKGAAA